MIDLIPDDIQKFFNKVPVMAFATANKKGQPNVNVMGSKKIVDGNKIWIIDTYCKKTKQNLLENHNVALSMWKGSEGYQFKGMAIYYDHGVVFRKAKKWILKIKPKKKVKGLIEVRIEAIYSLTPKPSEAGKRIV